MKNLIPSVLPALALLTLGGCAGTSYISTTENDGVYYSSKDQTTAVAPAVASTAPGVVDEGVAASPDDVVNPDYTGTTSARSGGSTEYYDDDYYYTSRLRRFHQVPYRGLGLGYYDMVYTDPFWYGGAPYAAWGPAAYYDPFFSPYWGGSFVNVNISFGRPWYRPWGYGAYSPYDYGYGYGYGRPWGGYGYGNGFYGGGGHYGGFYGGGFGGRYNRRAQQTVVTGTRTRMDNATEGVAPDRTTGVTGTRGRTSVPQGGIVAPGSTASGTDTYTPSPTGGRGRVRDVQPGSGQPGVTAPSGTQVAESNTATQPAGRRWRVLNETTSGAATEAGGAEPTRGRRAGSGWDNTGGTRQRTSDAGSAPAAQPRRERAAAEPTRTYSEPTRTYSEPSRSSSSPSRSYDSGGGSRGGSNSGGGGNNGGGGGNSGGGGRGRGN
ncbi:hypothetical protein [Hymenobacter tenuis]